MNDEEQRKELQQTLDAMDNVSKVVELWTGVKNMYLAQGWSPEYAEKMAYDLAHIGVMSQEVSMKKEILAIEKELKQL